MALDTHLNEDAAEVRPSKSNDFTSHLSELVRLCLHPKLAVSQGLIQREAHYTRELLHPLCSCDCCSAYSNDLAKAFLRETKGLSEVFQFTSAHYGRRVGLLNLLDFGDRFLLRARETAGFIRLKQRFQR